MALRAESRQRGAATAELAMALPILVALTVVMVWFVSVGVAQVRVTDAAREAARVIARGDSSAAARALVRRVGPPQSRMRVSSGDGTVRVVVVAVVPGPGGIFRGLSFRVRADAVAAAEE